MARDLSWLAASLAKKLMKVDQFCGCFNGFFQELCHLLAIFVDCSRSPCRSLLISKPTLCKTILSSSFVLESRTKTDKLFFLLWRHSPPKSREKQWAIYWSIFVDHDFCQIAWLACFNSSMRIKYNRTCQRSIKIVGVEKTFALHKSAQKNGISF